MSRKQKDSTEWLEDKGSEVAHHIFDDIYNHAASLRAFASLLKGFDYEENMVMLQNKNSYALGDIVNQWLDNLFSIINQYCNCPSGYRDVIAQVETYLSLINMRCMHTGAAINKLEQSIGHLEELYLDNELRERVGKLQETCRDYIRQLKGGENAEEK